MDNFPNTLDNALWDRRRRNLRQVVEQGNFHGTSTSSYSGAEPLMEDTEWDQWGIYLGSSYPVDGQYLLPQPYDPHPAPLTSVRHPSQTIAHDGTSVVPQPLYHEQPCSQSGVLGLMNYPHVNPYTWSLAPAQDYHSPSYHVSRLNESPPQADHISLMGSDEEMGIGYTDSPEISRYAPVFQHPTVPTYPTYLQVSPSLTPATYLSQEFVPTGGPYSPAQGVPSYGGYYIEGPRTGYPSDQASSYSTLPPPSSSHYSSSPSAYSPDFENTHYSPLPLQNQRQSRSSPYTVPNKLKGGQRQSGKPPSVPILPLDILHSLSPRLVEFYLNANDKAPRHLLLKTCLRTVDGKWECIVPGCNGQHSRTTSSAEYHARQHIGNRCFKCDSCDYHAYQKSDAKAGTKHKCKSTIPGHPPTDFPTLT